MLGQGLSCLGHECPEGFPYEEQQGNPWSAPVCLQPLCLQSPLEAALSFSACPVPKPSPSKLYAGLLHLCERTHPQQQCQGLLAQVWTEAARSRMLLVTLNLLLLPGLKTSFGLEFYGISVRAMR